MNNNISAFSGKSRFLSVDTISLALLNNHSEVTKVGGIPRHLDAKSAKLGQMVFFNCQYSKGWICSEWESTGSFKYISTTTSALFPQLPLPSLFSDSAINSSKRLHNAELVIFLFYNALVWFIILCFLL